MLNTIFQWIAFLLLAAGFYIVYRSTIIKSVLREGFELMAHKKYLWFIAAFAGLATYGGEVNFFMNRLDGTKVFSSFITSLQDSFVQGQAKTIWNIFVRVYKDAPMTMSAYVVGTIAFFLLMLWVIIMSQGILTRIAGRFAQKKQVSLFDAIRVTSVYFWDICKVSVMFLLLGGGVWVIVAGGPAILFTLTKNNGWEVMAQLGAYISLFVSAIGLFLLQYAIVELVVMEQPGAVGAIRRAWHILRRNLLLSIELSLGLFIVNMISLIVFAAVVVFFVFPESIQNLTADVLILFVQLGALTTISYGATVSLYMQMQQRQPGGVLSGWTEKIVNLAPKRPTV